MQTAVTIPHPTVIEIKDEEIENNKDEEGKNEEYQQVSEVDDDTNNDDFDCSLPPHKGVDLTIEEVVFENTTSDLKKDKDEQVSFYRQDIVSTSQNMDPVIKQCFSRRHLEQVVFEGVRNALLAWERADLRVPEGLRPLIDLSLGVNFPLKSPAYEINKVFEIWNTGCTDNRLDHTPDSSSTATTAPKTASANRSLLPDLSLDASLNTVW
ncbi:hypothetical protein Tco_0159153 [Tanacetum coccineum]